MTEKRLDLNSGKSAAKPNLKGKQVSEFSTFHAKMERFVDAAVSIYNAQQGGKGGTKRQAAHNSGHMLRTAYAGCEYVNSIIPENTGYKAKMTALSAITGLLHDLVRAPREVNGRSDGIITADLIDYMYSKDKSTGYDTDYAKEYRRLGLLFPKQVKSIMGMLTALDFAEVSAISDAIRVNEGTVKGIMKMISLLKETGRNRSPLLQEALLYGDKGVEGIGRIVVIRRFQFVSGERCENPNDIGAMKAAVFADGFSESELRALAFIGESMIRIYSKKSLDDFPNGGLWDSAKAGRNEEEKVYRTLLKFFLTRHQKRFGSEDDIFAYVLQKGFPKMASMEVDIFSKMRHLTLESPEMKDIEYERIVEVFNFGIALAYSQSRDPELLEESAICANLVSSEDLKSALKEADSGSAAGAIKERIRSLFID
jgi:hypothetical protein